LAPFSVVAGNVIVAAGVLLRNVRPPALRVTDAAVVACEVAGRTVTPAIATAASAASDSLRFLKMPIAMPPLLFVRIEGPTRHCGIQFY
jgi:hypothetical protein